MEKQRWEESERRSQEVRRSEKRKSGKQEDAGARKGREVAIHCVFPMICGSGGSKSNLAKAAGAEPAGQMRDEKVHAVVVRSTFGSWAVEKVHAVVARSTFPSQKVQDYKTCQHRTTFGSWAVEKVHAVVARSTFPSQNGKNTTCSHHFLTSRCWKSARGCGAKHISKSKVLKTAGFAPFWILRCRKSSQWLT